MSMQSTVCDYLIPMSYEEIVEQGSYVGRTANKLYEVWRVGDTFYSVNAADDTVCVIPNGFLRHVLNV